MGIRKMRWGLRFYLAWGIIIGRYNMMTHTTTSLGIVEITIRDRRTRKGNP